LFYNFNPIKLIHGAGSLGKLADEIKNYGKVTVLHGNSFHRHKNLLKDALNVHPIDFLHLESGDPTFKVIDELVMKVAQDTTLIIGVGGGRVMDAAKAISVCIGNGFNADDLLKVNPFTWVGTLPCVLISTRPGSGSENNNAFVLSKKTGRKYSLYSLYSYPKLAIQDPVFYNSLSLRDYAYGIADAVSHVIDQYLVEREETAFQDGLSLEMLRILGNLAASQNKVSDVKFLELAWISAFISSGILSRGVTTSWVIHEIAHFYAAITDCSHGESITSVFPKAIALERHPIDRLKNIVKAIDSSIEEGETTNREECIARLTALFENLSVKAARKKGNLKRLNGSLSMAKEHCPSISDSDLEYLCKLL
jgi:NADP-dependent alcohol dehydrogenase